MVKKWDDYEHMETRSSGGPIEGRHRLDLFKKNVTEFLQRMEAAVSKMDSEFEMGKDLKPLIPELADNLTLFIKACSKGKHLSMWEAAVKEMNPTNADKFGGHSAFGVDSNDRARGVDSYIVMIKRKLIDDNLLQNYWLRGEEEKVVTMAAYFFKLFNRVRQNSEWKLRVEAACEEYS